MPAASRESLERSLFCTVFLLSNRHLANEIQFHTPTCKTTHHVLTLPHTDPAPRGELSRLHFVTFFDLLRPLSPNFPGRTFLLIVPC